MKIQGGSFYGFLEFSICGFRISNCTKGLSFISATTSIQCDTNINLILGSENFGKGGKGFAGFEPNFD